MSDILMVDHFLSDRSQDIYNQKEAVCFGISPFNSYFSEELISELAQWGKQHFKLLRFFVPDIPSAYTLEAMGYDRETALKKAKKQCRYLKNKIKKGLSSAAVPYEQIDSHILDWQQLQNNSAFLQLYVQIKSIYNSESKFKSLCLEASKWVLQNRMDSADEPGKTELEIAVQYFLAEIPVFIDIAAIMGVNTAVFAYHQAPDFLKRLYNDELVIRPAESTGYLVLKEFTYSNT